MRIIILLALSAWVAPLVGDDSVTSEAASCIENGCWTNRVLLRTTIYDPKVNGSACSTNSNGICSAESNKNDNLLSGLFGALIAVVLELAVALIGHMRKRFSLLKAVRNECGFNLGILDEIASGIANGTNGSYKRVKSDFYAELRKIAYQYHFSDEMYEVMARVACDEDLLNRELDKLQEDLDPTIRLQVGRTALCAVNGVRGSLSRLKEQVEQVMSCCLLGVLNRMKGFNT